MRGLKDVSILAATAALALGIGAFGCSPGEPSVDAAPPVEEQALDIEGDIGEFEPMEEEDEGADY